MIYSTHPGEILKDGIMSSAGLSIKQTAGLLDVSYSLIAKLISGKRDISVKMAVKLEKVFGQDAEFWLGLQNEYDVIKLKNSGSYIGELNKLKRFCANK